MKILKKVNEVKVSKFTGSGWVTYFIADGWVACGTNFNGDAKWWKA